MGMQINTNLAALNTYRNLNNTQNSVSKSLERLSSGLRINSAADDAAGLAISQGLGAQVSGIAVATRNAQDGVSVVQTADGALGEVQTILQRVRDLAVQWGDGANNQQAKNAIGSEIQSLGDELTRIAGATNFNGTNLLQGAVAGNTDMTALTLNFQIGAGSTANDSVSLSIGDVGQGGANIKSLVTKDGSGNYSLTTSTAGTGGATLTLSGQLNDANGVLSVVDSSISSISSTRAALGATQNRFESAIRSLSVASQNLTSAKSRITDVDMASEMVNYTRSNILSQAGTAMLAQANQSNQGVLQLLR